MADDRSALVANIQAVIERSIAEAGAGKVKSADEVFARLLAKYRNATLERGQPNKQHK